MVLLDRCQDTLLEKINIQQGGFQHGLCCIMSSCMLRECIYYGYEQSFKVYTCFLDGKQTFDHVCHSGLFLKLMENNVDSTTLLSIREMYTNSRSRVKTQCLFSEEFPVLQGTRQGEWDTGSMEIGYTRAHPTSVR